MGYRPGGWRRDALRAGGDTDAAARYVECDMKHAASLNTLRAPSRAGLTAEAFTFAALEALHHIVPSYRNLFDWTDLQGNLIRFNFEGPIDHRIAGLYFEEFCNRREGGVMPEFRQSIKGQALVRSAEELDRPSSSARRCTTRPGV
jgi:hypothetical protein